MIKLLIASFFIIAFSGSLNAQEEEQSLDAEIKFGTEVEEREIVDEAETFPEDVYRVYAWSVITGAETPTKVTHIWEHEGKVIQEIDLDVNYARFRTWSYKTMGPYFTGEWTVRVVDEDGNVLEEGSFTIQE